MQTFLPYSDFIKSAMALDKKRCWKQVIEAHQIIGCLEGRKTGWKNHPAVKMWEDHIPELMVYFNVFLNVSKEKHKVNTTYPFFTLNDFGGKRELLDDGFYHKHPWWFGNENFHRAMRARLIEKKPEFYEPLWPNDKGFNDSKYFWPDNESKTFRVI